MIYIIMTLASLPIIICPSLTKMWLKDLVFITEEL